MDVNWLQIINRIANGMNGQEGQPSYQTPPFVPMRNPSPTMPNGPVNPSGMQRPVPSMELPMRDMYNPKRGDTATAGTTPQLPMGNILRPPQDDGAPTNIYGDMLKKNLDEYPGYQKPSRLRSIMAALTAAASSYGGDNDNSNAEGVAFGDRNKKIADWKMRNETLERLASGENADNINRRTIAHQRETETQGRTRLEETERKNREAESDRRNRTAVMQAKIDNPNLVFKTDENGEIVGLHPQTGAPMRTGIKASAMSDLEKLHLGLDAASLIEKRGDIGSRQIVERGDQAVRTEGVRQDNRVINQEDTQTHQRDMQNDRQQGSVDLVTTKANMGSLTGKPLPELEKQRMANTNARQLRDMKPEWSSYLVFDDKNNFVRVDPQGNGKVKQLSPAEVKDLSNQVYGRGANKDLVTTDTTKFSPQIEKSINDAVTKGMDRDNVIALLKKKGVIK